MERINMNFKFLTMLDRFIEWSISFIPNLVSACLILVIGYVMAKIFSKYATKALTKIDETLGLFFKNILFAGILLVTIVTALTNLGVETNSIIAVLGTAGLAIALSLKDSLSNLASGILLVVLRYFSRGDVISVGSITGKVDSINLFETRLTTMDNQIVILPNSSIVAVPITNINANKKRRMDLIFGIDYRSDLFKAKQVLEDLLKAEEIILQDPEPIVGIHALNASSVDLIVRFWIASEHYFQARIIVTQKVKLAFDKEGIEIPYNKLDVNLKPSHITLVKDSKL